MSVIPPLLLNQRYNSNFCAIWSNRTILQIEDALIDAYHKVQIVAVALDHAVLTQKKNNGRFQTQFENLSRYVNNILLDLTSTMNEYSVSPPRSVTGDIIPQEFSKLDKTESGPFCFIVLRECIKTLNYFTKMFQYFKDSQKVLN